MIFGENVLTLFATYWYIPFVIWYNITSRDTRKNYAKQTGKILKYFSNLFSQLKAQPLYGNFLISFVFLHRDL